MVGVNNFWPKFISLPRFSLCQEALDDRVPIPGGHGHPGDSRLQGGLQLHVHRQQQLPHPHDRLAQRKKMSLNTPKISGLSLWDFLIITPAPGTDMKR